MNRSAAIVWDLPTRFFHWGLVVCVVLNLFALEEGDSPHQWSGYIAASLVAMRLVWGLVTDGPSRLKALPVNPSQIKQFIRSGLSNPDDRFEGHNPMASLVYLAIWACIAGLATTGFMMDLDAFWGEDWLEDIHETISIGLQIFIGIHLLGVFIDSVRYNRKTWMRMIHGKK